MTNLLRMRGTDGVVRGGLSGLAGDNIGMWTGGTYQDAIDDKNSAFKSAKSKITRPSASNSAGMPM